MRTSKLLDSVLGALIVVASASLAHAAPVVAGPHSSAIEIRAARGAGTGPVGRLIFADTRDGKVPIELKIDLAPDYIRITDPERDIILDFRLRRLVTLSAGERAFVNTSLFADVAFRAYEFQNRLALGKVLSGAGITADKSPMTVAMIQAQLGLTIPGVAPTPIETTTDGDGTIHFRSEGKETARVRFSDKRLSAEQQKAFARFVRRGLILHPRIGDAMAGDGRLPVELWFLEYEGGFETKPRKLSLASDATAQLNYPLPANFTPQSIHFSRPHEGLNDLFPVMQAAVAGRAGTGPRTVESYRSAIEAAHQRKEHLQAAMLIMEASLQFGRKTMACPDDPVCTIFREANKDPQVQTLMKGLSYSGRDAPKGLPYLRSIDRKGLSNPYLLDIWIANDSGNSPEAAQLFASGIRGNPYVAPFYKDFGDYWYGNYGTPYAWFFYDFARNLPNASQVEMLDPLDKLEARLVSDFPLFF